MTYVQVDGRGCRPTKALPIVDGVGAVGATAAAIALATTCDDTHGCTSAYVGAGFSAAVAVAATLSAIWGAELPACPAPEDTARAQQLAAEARAAAEAHDCGTALLLVGKIAELDVRVVDPLRADRAIVACERAGRPAP